MISVVTALFNKEATIRRCIESVLSQTVPAREYIVVDDGSTDGGADIVRSFESLGVKLVSQPHRGVSSARNRGVAETSCEYVAFLDADDFWEAQFLEEMFFLLRAYPDCVMYSCQLNRVRADGSAYRFGRWPEQGGWHGILDNYYKAACQGPVVHSSSVMVSRAALLEVSGFPEDVHLGEDLDTWARLALRGNVCISTKRLANYVENVSPDRPSNVRRLQGLQPFSKIANEALKSGAARRFAPWLRRYHQFLLMQQALIALRWNDFSLAQEAIRLIGAPHFRYHTYARCVFGLLYGMIRTRMSKRYGAETRLV